MAMCAFYRVRGSALASFRVIREIAILTQFDVSEAIGWCGVAASSPTSVINLARDKMRFPLVASFGVPRDYLRRIACRAVDAVTFDQCSKRAVVVLRWASLGWRVLSRS